MSDEPLITLPSGKKVRVGDWVLVLGQVKGTPYAGDVSDPDDITVEFFSKTDQYEAVVRTSRIIDKSEPPEGWPGCNHMARPEHTHPKAVVCCERHDGHSGLHSVDLDEDGVFEWPSKQTIGYLVERS